MMDVFTLYVGQGALAAIRAGNEAVIVDAHMPNCDEVTQEQIESSLASYVATRRVRGLILTGFDDDHACPAGVESILTRHSPDWVLYPKYYKDTETASKVFSIIDRHEKNRVRSSRPLGRRSVRVDHVESRDLRDLSSQMTFELFSPHMEDMDSSNNSSIVVKVSGIGPAGFRYLITGDTETERWDRINFFFKQSLLSDVLAAAHHGSRNGVHPHTLFHVNPHTVLISAGVGNSYGHPHGAAVSAYEKVAKQVYATNSTSDGTCLFTRRMGDAFETRLVRHFDRQPAIAAQPR